MSGKVVSIIQTLQARFAILSQILLDPLREEAPLGWEGEAIISTQAEEGWE